MNHYLKQIEQNVIIKKEQERDLHSSTSGQLLFSMYVVVLAQPQEVWNVLSNLAKYSI